MTSPCHAPGDIVFGPVPSRRLGQSLGINHIPSKHCTYSCIYCQLGRTDRMTIERREFYPPDEILAAVTNKLAATEKNGETVDYLTFVPDGEPTLDIHLEREIDLLRSRNIPIAVITNASLIDNPEVRRALAKADWVSLKMDAVDEKTWRAVDRPHGSLSLDAILEGALAFSRGFSGKLVTETMLVSGVNDTTAVLEELAAFLDLLRPGTAYLSIPIRPPAESGVRAPDATAMTRAWRILSAPVDKVETLTGYEGNAFAASGDVAADLLSITAVHPMREDAVEELLARSGGGRDIVERLVAEGKILRTEFDGFRFYLRNFKT
ncbi:MAG: radical SAM protein [Acidobacteriota bacterium]|jgi:wyosine [tRNA(Phe)-imidazoG37] synthetase (radical SAM superfamily)|nr:radical SAM protein [Acidobacteriota bacterium]